MRAITAEELQLEIEKLCIKNRGFVFVPYITVGEPIDLEEIRQRRFGGAPLLRSEGAKVEYRSILGIIDETEEPSQE